MDAGFEKGQSEAESQHLETIALLQDEVARLESELAAREQFAPELPDEPAPPPGASAADVEERERLARELAAREETIGLLLEQLRLVEEAERATREEWEQLASWLAEVEDRVDRKEQEAPGGAAERLAALERQAEDARATHARDRNAWQRERRELGRENERLGALLARHEEQKEHAPEAPANDARLVRLEAEKCGLADRCRELEAEHAQQVQVLTESLEEARRKLDVAGRRAAAVDDERARERREYEIALTSLRAQGVRASLHAEPADQGAPASPAEPHGGLEADVRIHVFRQHLREIHEQEEEARRSSRLGARLSRLWGRTAPEASTATAGRKS